MKTLFDDAAVMNGYLNGQLVKGSPELFFAQLESMPSLESVGAPYEAKIEAVNADDAIGSVTIRETGFGPMSFTNYLHIMKDSSGWKIVSKTFFGKQ